MRDTWFYRRLRQWGSSGGVILFTVLLIVAGVWAFVAILGEVREGDTKRFDERVILFFGAHQGPPWLREAGRDLTALGGVTVLTLTTAAVLGFLLLMRRFGMVWLVLVAILGGFVLSMVLKDVIDRPRPQLVPHGSLVYTSSFPSGHSMLSAVTYLTLGSLLGRTVRSRLVKLYFLFVAMLLSFLIGVSRVYLGVHWPTDVLAGWCAGLAWALLCWVVARELQRRGAVEQDSVIS